MVIRPRPLEQIRYKTMPNNARETCLLYLGASPLQLPLLTLAKSMGFYLVVTDKNAADEVIKIADEVHALSATDDKAVLELAENLQKRFDLKGLYCGSDFGLLTIAKISARLSLPASRPEPVQLSLDKQAALKVLDKSGLRIPHGVLYHQGDILPPYTGRCVVKPVDSSGSRGVKIVNKPEAMDEAIQSALLHSETKTLLIEEQVQGRHLDVSGFMVEGEFFPAGILDRHFSPAPYSYPIYGVQPPVGLSEPDLALIYEVLADAALALGLTTGPIKGDFIHCQAISKEISKQSLVILEVSPRFHGDTSTTHVTMRAYGKTPVEDWFTYLLNGSLPEQKNYYLSDCIAGWMGIFPKSPGILKNMQWPTPVGNEKDKAEIYQHRNKGFVVKQVADNTALLGFIWARAETEQALINKLKQLRNSISIEMQNEENR